MPIFYIDGQSIGNERKDQPRRAKIALVLQPGSTTSQDISAARVVSEEIGDKTNNEAEYHALLRLLSILSARWAGKDGRIMGPVGKVRILSDSELLVHQVNGDWKVDVERLSKLRDDARNQIDKLGSISLEWVPRERNFAGLWLEGKWNGKRVEAKEFLSN